MAMLDKLITIDRLKKLAGATTFQRGEEYFTSGLVDRLLSDEQKISANVIGTETYRVKLWPGKVDELRYDCTCPRRCRRIFLQALCGSGPCMVV